MKKEIICTSSISSEDLDYIISNVQKDLTDLPDGLLKTSISNNITQYYIKQDMNDARYHYLSKDQKELAYKIAQRDYDKKLLKAAVHVRKYINASALSALNDLRDIYDSLSPARQELVHPYIITKKEYIKIWSQHKEEAINKYWFDHPNSSIDMIRPQKRMINKDQQQILPFDSQSFNGSNPMESNHIEFNHIESNHIESNHIESNHILTEQGEIVRSKSEKIIADKLSLTKIPYYYEVPICLNGFGFVRPDFTILNPYTLKEYYWEHLGMMSSPEYVDKALSKIELYTANGILPGRDLILSYESESHPVSTNYISTLISTIFK